MENDNLNKQYALLGYNIDIVKDVIVKMTDNKLLSMLPTTTIPKNTLFHYYDKLSKSDIDKLTLNLGEKQIVNEEETILPYHYQYTNVTNKQNVDIILFNDKSLKLLDVTQISIELGFNPLYFYFNNILYKTDEDVIYDYCKHKKLDGYINLNEPLSYVDTNNNCPLFVHHNDITTLCPTIYLLNYKNYGVTNLNTLGVINLLTKNKSYLDIHQVNKLYNQLFCNISNLIEIISDVKTSPNINNHILSFIHDNQEYDFTKIYKNKNILDSLQVDYSNLNDFCEFDCCGQDMNEIKNLNLPINKVDIFVDYPINTNKSADLFKNILNVVSQKHDINDFLLNNYEEIAKIQDYHNLLIYINQAKSIEDIKRIIGDLEKHIVNKIYTNYKASNKGYKGNINFINLQYIPITYKYLINKIMGELEQLDIQEVINIIKNDNNKNINKYFNIDTFFIDIAYHLYNKPSKLVQDLLNDITTYKNGPIINLSYLKTIIKLDDNDELKNKLKQINLEIYDVYKSFIKGDILFDVLYQFLDVDTIYNYLLSFANKNNLNISLVMYYYDISKQKDMDDYNLQTLKTLKNVDEFEEQLNNIKTFIIVNRTLQVLVKQLNLNPDKPQVKNFLMVNIERIIDQYLNNINSDLSQFVTNNESQFNVLFNEDLNVNNIYQELLNYNTNEVMLDYIYKQLKVELINKNKILKLVKNKNLFDIYLQYLRNEVTKSDLEKAVFVNLKEEIINEKEVKPTEKSTKQQRLGSPRRSHKRKNSEEEHTEEM